MRDKQNGFLARAADYLSLPADAVAGLFHLELIGARELYLENHNGILEYSDTEIVLHGGDRLIRILGHHLNLCAMNDAELRLSGTLDSITFTSL